LSRLQNDILVGYDATSAQQRDGSTFYSVKRLIGRLLHEVATESADLSYAVTARSSYELHASSDSAATEVHPSSGDSGCKSSGGSSSDRSGAAEACSDVRGSSGTSSSDDCQSDGRDLESTALRVVCPARQALLAPEEVSAQLLKHLLARAASLTANEGDGADIEHAVITVPAHFGPVRREATKRAARLAGLKGVNLLQEPVAAAIAYGLGRPQDDAETILVVDVGGGTTDISVLESFEGIIEVLSTDGDSRLGGDDFDRLIAGWALRESAAQAQQHHQSNPERVNSREQPPPTAVMAVAEAAKVALSTADSTTVIMPALYSHAVGPSLDNSTSSSSSNIASSTGPADSSGNNSSSGSLSQAVTDGAPTSAANTSTTGSDSGSAGSGEAGRVDVGGGAVEVVLTRAAMEEAVDPLLRRLWEPMRRAGSAVHLEWAARPFGEVAPAPVGGVVRDRFAPPPRRITKALLVGGGTRMPAVQALVAEVTGLKPDVSLDPELAVALGAGIQAGILAGQLSGPLELMDGSYNSLMHNRAIGRDAYDVL